MKILLISRPISAPWDEGTKNIFKEITDQLPIERLTAEEGTENSTHIYSSPKWNIQNKIRLFMYLLLKMNKYNRIILAFSPTKQNIRLFTIAQKITNYQGDIIQFLPSLPKDSTITNLLVGSKYIVISEFSKYILIQNGIIENKIFHLRPFVKPINAKKTQIIHKQFLYLGEFSKRLGSFPLLQSIILKVLKTDPSISFHLACRIFTQHEQEAKNIFLNSIRNTGLANNVKVSEFIPDVIDEISASHATIFPVTSMGNKFDIPLVLLESIALDKPTLISNIKPLNEIYQSDLQLNNSFCIENTLDAWVSAILKTTEGEFNYSYKTLQSDIFSFDYQINKLSTFLYE